MDFEQARFNMVEQQVRPWEVLDAKVLELMHQVPREDFVPSAFRKLAYSDSPIPMNSRETMLIPREIGRLLQAVQIHPSEIVLEIGTGTGYLTALLAKLAKQVFTVDIDPDLLEIAKKNLNQLHIKNVSFCEGDAAKGWSRNAPYNVIIITGAMSQLPESYKKNLAPGGRLFMVTGDMPVMQARLVTKLEADQWQTTTLFETVQPYLKNAYQPKTFEF